MSAPREVRPVPFVLASASPSRRRLLEQAGLRPQILVSGVDEEAIEEEMRDRPVPEVALALARAKAEAVAAGVGPDGHALVLGCDSIFEVDGVRLVFAYLYALVSNCTADMQRWHAGRQQGRGLQRLRR